MSTVARPPWGPIDGNHLSGVATGVGGTPSFSLGSQVPPASGSVWSGEIPHSAGGTEQEREILSARQMRARLLSQAHEQRIRELMAMEARVQAHIQAQLQRAPLTGVGGGEDEAVSDDEATEAVDAAQGSAVGTAQEMPDAAHIAGRPPARWVEADAQADHSMHSTSILQDSDANPESLEQLCDMGFTRPEALQALRVKGGNLQAAADLLITGGEQ